MLSCFSSEVFTMSVALTRPPGNNRYSVAAKRVDVQIAGYRSLQHTAGYRSIRHVDLNSPRLGVFGSIFSAHCFSGAISSAGGQSRQYVATWSKIADIIEEYCGTTANQLIRYDLIYGGGQATCRFSNLLKLDLLRARCVTRSIELQGIALKDGGLLIDILDAYPTIAVLNLSSCGIENGAHAFLGCLNYGKHLEALDLSNNQLISAVDAGGNRLNMLSVFTDYKKLTHLNLRNSVRPNCEGLIATDLLAFWGHPSLQYLDLSKSYGICSGADKAIPFAKMPALRTLVVQECPDFSFDFLVEMQRVCPKVQVVFLDDQPAEDGQVSVEEVILPEMSALQLGEQ